MNGSEIQTQIDTIYTVTEIVNSMPYSIDNFDLIAIIVMVLGVSFRKIFSRYVDQILEAFVGYTIKKWKQKRVLLLACYFADDIEIGYDNKYTKREEYLMYKLINTGNSPICIDGIGGNYKAESEVFEFSPNAVNMNKIPITIDQDMNCVFAINKKLILDFSKVETFWLRDTLGIFHKISKKNMDELRQKIEKQTI